MNDPLAIAILLVSSGFVMHNVLRTWSLLRGTIDYYSELIGANTEKRRRKEEEAEEKKKDEEEEKTNKKKRRRRRRRRRTRRRTRRRVCPCCNFSEKNTMYVVCSVVHRWTTFDTKIVWLRRARGGYTGLTSDNLKQPLFGLGPPLHRLFSKFSRCLLWLHLCVLAIGLHLITACTVVQAVIQGAAK